MPLTKRKIDALEYNPNGPKRQVHFDTDGVPGFGVVVSPMGTKTFVLMYRPRGSSMPKRLTIGRYGTLTLDQARKIAQDELHSVKKGDDPAERRRAARLEGKRSITLRDFSPLYLDNARTKGNPGRKTRRPKKTWKQDERRIAKYLLPVWGKRRLTDITRTDVRRLHNSIEARYEANRVLNLVSVMFESARMLGYVDEDAKNPTKGITPFEERSRDRFVTEAEMPKLMEAIRAEENPHLRTAFVLYLMTGLRRSELVSLRWTDVNMSTRSIRLPDTKAGEPQIRVLPRAAAELLEQLPRLLGNPYVIPSPSIAGAHMHHDALTKAWGRIRARMWIGEHPKEAAKLRAKAEAYVARRKLEAPKASDRAAMVEARMIALAAREVNPAQSIRLHDLRRTTGSWLAMYAGASLPMIGAILGHKNAITTQIYARWKNEATRDVADEHAERIAAFIGGAQ